jgi:CRISPR-associated endonuclease/helicase Cas3
MQPKSFNQTRLLANLMTKGVSKSLTRSGRGLCYAGSKACWSRQNDAKKEWEKGSRHIGETVRRLAIVVNRVNLAREVFDKLTRDAGANADVLLLTGRIRPLDRDRLFADGNLRLLFAASRDEEPERPIILVATQTIEAGADLDVDALITEIAPLDCLRQRFGRLDRLGTRGTSRAVILAPKTRDEWKLIERLYGDAPRNTRDWLNEIADEPDFGIAALQPFMDVAAATGKLESLLAPRANAPVLLPTYVDLWGATSPAPAATPEPSLFLHGPSVSTDVQIVWRADIDPAEIDVANLSLEICPPSALEALAVPIWAVQRWLRQQPYRDISDVSERDPEADDKEPPRGFSALRYKDDGWHSIFPSQIRPADTIVVPTSYGGCDAFGWNPDSKGKVIDRGAEAHYRQRLKGALRLTSTTLANAINAERRPDDPSNSGACWRRVAALVADADDDIDADAVIDALAAFDDLPTMWRRLLGGMKFCQPEIEFYDDQSPSAGFMLYTRRPLARGLLDATEDDQDAGAEAISDSEKSSATGVQVSLVDHLAHVEAKVLGFTHAAGLDGRLTELLALAARLHDLVHRF